MEVVHARVAGLDVHKAEVRAAVRVLSDDGELVEEVASFATTTPALLGLRDWLVGHAVTKVAMEATGEYWKPVYYALEDDVDVWLVNARFARNVTGKKTDTIDAAWLAQLLASGLLKKSFVPPLPIRELRDLTRYRKARIEDRSRQVNRLGKILQDSGIKLSSFATDIVGVSGRRMLRALVAGERDPDALADLAKGRLRDKIPLLRAALQGRFTGHHAFLVERILDSIEQIEDDITALSTRIDGHIDPFARREIELLDTIPGISTRAAQVIVAEIGTDMTRFATEHHLASWAALCPGQHESAGKNRSGRTRKGSRALRTVLVEAANAAARSRSASQFTRRYRRIRARRGHPKAILAVAHAILRTVWHVLTNHQPYREPERTHDRDDYDRRRALRALERLGYTVQLTTRDAAAT